MRARLWAVAILQKIGELDLNVIEGSGWGSDLPRAARLLLDVPHSIEAIGTMGEKHPRQSLPSRAQCLRYVSLGLEAP
jgi:hypothetical protein